MHDQAAGFSRERNLSLIHGNLVEFVHIKYKDPTNNHQWITRIVCGDKLTTDKLYTIHSMGMSRSQLKWILTFNMLPLWTQDLMTGTYTKAAMTSCYFSVHILQYTGTRMDYMHGAASLAAIQIRKSKIPTYLLFEIAVRT